MFERRMFTGRRDRTEMKPALTRVQRPALAIFLWLVILIVILTPKQDFALTGRDTTGPPYSVTMEL